MMHQVFQTIICPEKGNCMQANYASLFELDLEDVPNFALWWSDNPPDKRHWSQVQYDFLDSLGCYTSDILYNPVRKPKLVKDYSLNELENMPGMGGYFYAAVYSPAYHQIGKTHAVIIDRYFNIVHDLNPNYLGKVSYPKANMIGFNGVFQVNIIKRFK